MGDRPTTAVRVRTTAVLGDVPPLIYGHFTEHLGPILYDGMWAEKLFGRKFEAPMASRVGRAELAEPWEAFLGRRDGTTYSRGPHQLARVASPQGGAHHAQGVATAAGTVGERGIAQAHVVLDAGVALMFRASVRRIGPAGTLRVALRSADGETVVTEATIDVPVINSTRFGPEFPHNALWMDDQSWTTVEVELTSPVDDTDGWLTMTFEPDTEQDCFWMFDWVSLMPDDTIHGWHRGVAKALHDLPAQSLKWPGGCMAEDYDWRYGLGPRDTRYGNVDQAWGAWDENDVGIDEFMALCRFTGAEPVIGVNGGNGSPEMAAELVEYCNGSIDTEWGAKRAANGHPKPYDVRNWVIGNEQWGFFAVGYAGPVEYARRYLRIARAMKERDPSINLAAVGHIDGFSKVVLTVLAQENALDLVDMLQIHAYTPEGAFPVTDPASATAKIRSAELFDRVLDRCRTDIASVPGAEHVTVCLDEWGWGHAGHTGAMFMAAGLNAFHRAAPLVRIGSKAAVVNVDGVIDRHTDTAVRTPAYDVFRLFNEGHLPNAVAVEVANDDVDVSALADDESSRVTVHLVNASHEPTPVELTVDGHDAGSVAIVTTIVPREELTGSSAVTTTSGKLGDITVLPPLSLTSVRIGTPEAK
jgi:alpha-N-arabinofuranosidase